MNIEFSSAEANYLKAVVERGYFPSEAEAVTAAVKLLREQSELKERALRDALAEGEADIAAGRVFEYTPEFMDEVMEEAKSLVRSGQKIVYDPNVIP